MKHFLLEACEKADKEFNAVIEGEDLYFFNPESLPEFKRKMKSDKKYLEYIYYTQDCKFPFTLWAISALQRTYGYTTIWQDTGLLKNKWFLTESRNFNDKNNLYRHTTKYKIT
jgi:hypothetical protein